MDDEPVIVLHLPTPPESPPIEVYLIAIIDPMWPDRWILNGEIWHDENIAMRRADEIRTSCHYSALDARVERYRRA